ncbi:ABC transporter [Citrobacter koseri]|nr:ABC transporter [Citrobacter koseri]
MDDLLPDLTLAFNETFQMLSISTVLAVVGGLPLGFLIFCHRPESVLAESLRVSGEFGSGEHYPLGAVRDFAGAAVAAHAILLGNTIGPIAASVPLSVAAIAFYARLVDSALREVDKGIIEAAEAFGASPMRIICTVLLPEASAGLLRGLTITLVSLIGYSAMAGIVGGGGVGDLAIRYGYYRYETQVMIVTVVALIILVQVVQMLGDWLAKRADKRDRH